MKGFYSGKEQNLQQHLTVISIGGFDKENKRLWSADDLLPAVRYNFEGTDTKSPYFKGFVFSPVTVRDDYYIHPLYAGFGQSPTKEDWEAYTNILFEPGYNLHALNELAVVPLDIWLGIPYPMKSQLNFGTLNGQSLSFQTQSLRKDALDWWLQSVMEHWKQAGLTNLQLKGFYWMREVLLPEDEELLVELNDSIHAHSYKAMWLPNYGGYGAMNPWKGEALNFDVTAVNPNYYGNTSLGPEWINHASLFSRVVGTGLQINIGKGITFSPYHIYDYLNLGLPHRNNFINDCFLVFQFYDLSIREYLNEHKTEYQQIYNFMNKLYTEQSYPGRPY